MTEGARSPEDIARIKAELRSRFVHHEGYQALRARYRDLIAKRTAELALGLISEGRGIAVIGESGSGKTTAVQRILRHDGPFDAAADEIRWISLRVPTPATQKDLTRAMLVALKFPIARDTTASRMWELVHHHLALRRTWFIHLDEGQELGGRGSDAERAGVINSLKSLMQIPDWPLNLIVSGTPELRQLLQQDAQLSRRFYIVPLAPINEIVFRDHVRDLIARYAQLAGLPLARDLDEAEFVPRLIHAAREQFGILLELLIDALAHALAQPSGRLDRRAFSAAYAERTGAILAANPFDAPDFRTVPNGRTPPPNDDPPVRPRKR